MYYSLLLCEEEGGGKPAFTPACMRRAAPAFMKEEQHRNTYRRQPG